MINVATPIPDADWVREADIRGVEHRYFRSIAWMVTVHGCPDLRELGIRALDDEWVKIYGIGARGRELQGGITITKGGAEILDRLCEL